jgi:hypothetical protein
LSCKRSVTMDQDWKNREGTFDVESVLFGTDNTLEYWVYCLKM